jgi:hypothetical protein
MGFTFSIDNGRKYVIFLELRMKGDPTVHIEGKQLIAEQLTTAKHHYLVMH